MVGCSVVVPTYNRPDGLVRLLRSLNQQTLLPSEVIVIDDSPTLESEIKVNEWSSNSDPRFDLIYHRNQVRAGLGASKNQAIDLARGEFIAFTDDDCVVDPGWLEGLAAAIVSSGPDVAGVGGIKRPLHVKGPINRYYQATHNTSTRRSLDTCNCMLRKETLASVGGYDVEPPPFPEDTGLSLRLVWQGRRFEVAPNALVLHEWPEDLTYFRRKARLGGMGEHAMYTKLMGRQLTDLEMDYMRRAGWDLKNFRSTPLTMWELIANGLWQFKLWCKNGTSIGQMPSLMRLWYINAMERRLGWDDYLPTSGTSAYAGGGNERA
jgi:glycosyltransferase involved in cell wall biosynthesis